METYQVVHKEVAAMDIKSLIRTKPSLYRFLSNVVEKYNALRWKLAKSNCVWGGTERLIAKEYKNSNSRPNYI